MELSRFRGHYVIPDRETPAEEIQKLVSIMAENVKTNYESFKQPSPPYVFKEDATAYDSYRWMRTYFLPDTLLNSVIFGFGIGGLLAVKLQEEFPARNLSVVAINAPTTEGTININSEAQGRVALYSSSYTPISDRCNWAPLSKQAFDVPWLRNGIKNTKYGLAYLLTAYMLNESISGDIASLSGASPEMGKATGA